MTQNEYFPGHVLVPHFTENASIVGVEIGVMSGVGSLGMLSKLPNLKLYCVDPWKHCPGEEFEAGMPQEVLDENYDIAKERIGRFPDRGFIVKKRSDDALDDVPDNLDFVFIDGHHRYEQVKRDISNYFKKVKKGGIIAGHDYGQVPEVTQAVDEFFAASYTIHKGEDFVWWVNL